MATTGGIIKWDNSFSVGVEEIDVQHKKLISLINTLHDAMKVGKGKEVMGGILKELVDYTNYHFGTEENYFDKFKYPEADIHKLEHQKFTKQVLDFKSKFENNQAYITMDLMNFLTNWLTNHIKITDKKYGPFLNEHGVK